MCHVILLCRVTTPSMTSRNMTSHPMTSRPMTSSKFDWQLWWRKSNSKSHAIRYDEKILASDWSICTTWPKYWSLIGYWQKCLILLLTWTNRLRHFKGHQRRLPSSSCCHWIGQGMHPTSIRSECEWAVGPSCQRASHLSSVKWYSGTWRRKKQRQRQGTHPEENRQREWKTSSWPS